jgi:hypothetical protein
MTNPPRTHGITADNRAPSERFRLEQERASWPDDEMVPVTTSTLYVVPAEPTARLETRQDLGGLPFRDRTPDPWKSADVTDHPTDSRECNCCTHYPSKDKLGNAVHCYSCGQ